MNTRCVSLTYQILALSQNRGDYVGTAGIVAGVWWVAYVAGGKRVSHQIGIL